MALGTSLPTRLAAPTTTYVYVDQSIGSDSNTRVQAMSESTPWLTVQKALSSVVAGDTIRVKNGTYSPPGGFGGSTQYRHEASIAGTSVLPITLEAYPGHKPIIQSSSDASAGNPTSALKILATCAYFRVGRYSGYSTTTRLIFQRQSTNKGNNQVIDISADAPSAGAHDIEIIGNELRNAYTASLIYAGDNCSRVDVYCNEFHSPAGYRDTETTLAAGIDNVTTTVTVASGTGFSNGDFVRIEAEGVNTTEIIQISSGGGTGTWTVLRAQKSTVASAHAISAVVCKGNQHHACYQTGDICVVANNWVHDMPQSFGLQTRTNQANPGQSPQNVYVVNNTSVDCRQDHGSGPGGGTGGLLEGRALTCVVANNIFKGNGNRGLDGGVPSGPSAQTTTVAVSDALNNTTDPVSFTVASASGFPTTNPFYILVGSEVLRVTAGAGTTSWTASRGQLGSTNAVHAGTPTVTSHEASGNIARRNIAQGNTASQFSHSNSNWRILNFDAASGFTFGSGPGDNLTSDPLFTSYTPGPGTSPDCTLQSGSPAILYGLEQYCPTFDFYGNTRSAADAGAFAYSIATQQQQEALAPASTGEAPPQSQAALNVMDSHTEVNFNTLNIPKQAKNPPWFKK